MTIHQTYMNRCLQLAQNGLGSTSPNPLVGCVMVNDGHIISEGWHRKMGEPHAEVLAINKIMNPSLLKKTTLYVNLEPCCHYGSTPPCTDFIIKKGIQKVVIGCTDINPKIAGKGIRQLRKQGVEVITEVLETDCQQLNKRFFTFQSQQRPYIILKWAQSSEGNIDIVRSRDSPKEPFWITNKASRQLTHRWRAEEDAILIGTRTAINDNPKLNIRHWNGKQPLRVIIDRKAIITSQSTLCNDGLTTLLFTEKNIPSSNIINWQQIDFGRDIIPQILQSLYNRKVQSLIVEGGAQTLQSFIDARLWDEARVFAGSVSIPDGLKAPVFLEKPKKEIHLQKDSLRYYYR